MPTEKIKCRACGFGALLFTTGESAKLIVDSAKQVQVCKRLKDRPKGRKGPLDCRDFRDVFQRPATPNNSGSPSFDDETQSEALETKEATAERDGDDIPVRSRRSSRAEVAEIGAGSQKEKSARRPSKKSTGRRSAHSDAPIVPGFAPTAS